MNLLLQDLKYAFRTLRGQPAVTAIAILSLALGIGANTTIFTAVNAVFLSQIPVEAPDRLARVHTIDWEAPDALTGVSFPNYEDIRDGNTTFAALAAYTTSSVNLIPDGGEARQITARVVTGNYFDVLGVRAARGRTFLPDEDRAPTAVVVLSHGMWEREFGADPNVVGRAVNLSGQTFEVIGVMPPDFKGLQVIGDPNLVWFPLAMRHLMFSGRLAQYFDLRRGRFAQSIGRLRDGVTVEQANAEVHNIGARLEEEFPTDNRGREMAVRQFSTLSAAQRERYTRVGVLLMSVVGLVLLIACANTANLLLARAADREKEIAIRVAMGAGRGRLMRQLLTESVLLAVLAGGVGVLFARWGRDLLWAYRPPNFGAQSIDLSLDVTVLVFTLGVAVATGVLFGLVPALHASTPDLRSTLQEGGRRSVSGTSRTLLRQSLVVAEVALALVALIGAGLFIRSLTNAQSIDPGFESERLVLFNLNVGNAGYSQADGEQFYDELLERLRAVPGVEGASVQSGRLLGGGLPHTTFPEGVDIAGGRGLHVHDVVVSPTFFETIGVPLVSGRVLNDFDRAGPHHVAVVNEATKRLFWPDTDPVGRRFTRSVEGFPIEVVGVVGDALIDLGEPAQPVIYTPLRQFYQSAVEVEVRTSGAPDQQFTAIQDVIRQIDPALPVLGIRKVTDDLQQALWAPRMGAALLGIFGLLATLLAMVGIYGVMSYSVRQRHHEIGLRLALGARGGQIVGLVMKQGMRLVGIGVVTGIALAAFTTRLIQSMLWEVNPLDPITFGAVSLGLIFVSAVAHIAPAARVTKVDPLTAMRDEY